MPGAEPAGPPPGPAPMMIGHVIELNGRRRSRRSAPPPPPVAATPAVRGPAVELALTVEAMFLDRRRTLTDPATAEAYDVTMDAVRLMLSGAAAHGVIDAEQQQTLEGMLAGMQDAPTVL